jgi:hypothetical protein
VEGEELLFVVVEDEQRAPELGTIDHPFKVTDTPAFREDGWDE